MRLFLSSSLLFALVASSGCSAPDEDLACPPTNTWARVDRIDGPTVEVVLMDFSRAVLHTEGAEFLYLAGEECFESRRDLLTVGQEIEVQVDGWEKSLPPQAHVDAIVVRG